MQYRFPTGRAGVGVRTDERSKSHALPSGIATATDVLGRDFAARIRVRFRTICVCVFCGDVSGHVYVCRERIPRRVHAACNGVETPGRQRRGATRARARIHPGTSETSQGRNARVAVRRDCGGFRFEKSSNVYFSLSIMCMVFEKNYTTENTPALASNFSRTTGGTRQARLSFFSPGRGPIFFAIYIHMPLIRIRSRRNYIHNHVRYTFSLIEHRLSRQTV